MSLRIGIDRQRSISPALRWHFVANAWHLEAQESPLRIVQRLRLALDRQRMDSMVCSLGPHVIGYADSPGSSRNNRQQSCPFRDPQGLKYRNSVPPNLGKIGTGCSDHVGDTGDEFRHLQSRLLHSL